VRGVLGISNISARLRRVASFKLRPLNLHGNSPLGTLPSKVRYYSEEDNYWLLPGTNADNLPVKSAHVTTPTATFSLL